MREQYDRFGQAWRRERDYQAYLLAHREGARVMEQKLADDRIQKFIVLPDEQPIAMLGRKPTFHEWMVAAENKARAARAEAEKRGVVEVTDEEWKDT